MNDASGGFIRVGALGELRDRRQMTPVGAVLLMFRRHACRAPTIQALPRRSFAAPFSMPVTASSRSRKPHGSRHRTLPPVIGRPI